MIKIEEHRGQLYISPMLHDLRDELRMFVMEPRMKEITFFSKREQKEITVMKRDGWDNKMEDLFQMALDNETGQVRRGLFRRVVSILESHGLPWEYSTHSSLPQFVFSPECLAGLYPEQARAVINILSEIGVGEVGWEADSSKIPRMPGSGGALIDATMSTGKTHMICALIKCFPDTKVLVVTKKKAVIDRLEEGIMEIMGNELGKVGVFTGDKKHKHRVTICSEALIDEFIEDGIGLIICDEVHNSSGSIFSSSLAQMWGAIKVGLSGTIGKHKKIKYIESLFGPIVDRITDHEAEEKDRVAKVKVYSLDTPSGPYVDDLGDIGRERRGITLNHQRNKLIKEVGALVPEEHQMIVFVRTIEHIDHLKEKYLPGYEIYHGQISTKEKKRIGAGLKTGEIKRVIANEALSEGVNTVKLRVVVEAGWQTSDIGVSQRGGRNRRKDDGKNIGIIVTFADNWQHHNDVPGDEPVTTCLKNRASERLKNYKDRGWPIVKVKTPSEIDFDEISNKKEIQNP